MFRLLKHAILSACLLAGGAAALPAAHADSLYLGINDGRPGFGVYAGEGGYRRWHRDDDRRDRDRDPRWRQGGYASPRCTPDRALFKAARLGLRRVWVSDVDWRTISVSGSVSGRRYGERATVTFARAPFCPVIGW